MTSRNKRVELVKTSIQSLHARFFSSTTDSAKKKENEPMEGQPGYKYLIRHSKNQKDHKFPENVYEERDTSEEDLVEEREREKKEKTERPRGYGRRNFVPKEEALNFYGNPPVERAYKPNIHNPLNEKGERKSTMVFPQGDKGNTALKKAAGFKERDVLKRLEKGFSQTDQKYRAQKLGQQFSKKTDFSFEAYLNWEDTKQRPPAKGPMVNRQKPGQTVDDISNLYPGQGKREMKFRDGTTGMQKLVIKNSDTPFVTKDFQQEKTTRVIDKKGKIVALFMDLDGNTIRVDHEREQEYQDNIFRTKNNSKFLKQQFDDGAYPQFEVRGYANEDKVLRNKQFDIMNEMKEADSFKLIFEYMRGYGYEENYDSQKLKRRVPKGVQATKQVFGEKAALGLGMHDDMLHTQQGVVTPQVAKEVGAQQHGGVMMEHELRAYLEKMQVNYFLYSKSKNPFLGPELKKQEGIPNYDSFQGRASAQFTMIPQNQVVIIKQLMQTYLSNQMKPVVHAKEITESFKKEMVEVIGEQKDLVVLDRGSNNFGISRKLLPENEGHCSYREYEVTITSKFDYPVVGGVISEISQTRRLKVPKHVKIELVGVELGIESMKSGYVGFSGPKRIGTNVGEYVSKLRNDYLLPRVSTEHGDVGNGNQKVDKYLVEKEEQELNEDEKGMKGKIPVHEKQIQSQKYADDFAGPKKWGEDMAVLQTKEGEQQLKKLEQPLTKENMEEVKKKYPGMKKIGKQKKGDVSEVYDFQEMEQVGGLGVSTVGDARQFEYNTEPLIDPMTEMHTNDMSIPMKLYKSKQLQTYNDKLGYRRDRSIDSVAQRKEKGYYNQAYQISVPSAELNSLRNTQYVFSSYATGEVKLRYRGDILSHFVTNYLDYTQEEFDGAMKTMQEDQDRYPFQAPGKQKLPFRLKPEQKLMEVIGRKVLRRHQKKLLDLGQVEGPIPATSRESRKRKELPNIGFTKFVMMTTYAQIRRKQIEYKQREKTVVDKITIETRVETLLEGYEKYCYDRFMQIERQDKTLLSQYGRDILERIETEDPEKELQVTPTKLLTQQEIFAAQRKGESNAILSDRRFDKEFGAIEMEGPYLQKGIKRSQNAEEEWKRRIDVRDEERRHLMQKLMKKKDDYNSVKNSLKMIFDSAKRVMTEEAEISMQVGYGAEPGPIKGEVEVQCGANGGCQQLPDGPEPRMDEGAPEDEFDGDQLEFDNEEDLKFTDGSILDTAAYDLPSMLEPHVKYQEKDFIEKYDEHSHRDRKQERFAQRIQDFQMQIPRGEFTEVQSTLLTQHDKAPISPLVGFFGKESNRIEITNQVKNVRHVMPYVNGHGLFLCALDRKGDPEAKKKRYEFFPEQAEGQKFLPVEEIPLRQTFAKDMGIQDEYDYYKLKEDRKTDQSEEEQKMKFSLPAVKKPQPRYTKVPPMEERKERTKELLDGDTIIQPFLPTHYFKEFGMYEDQGQKDVLNRELQEKTKKEKEAERFKQKKRVQKGLDKNDTSQDDLLFGENSKKSQGKSYKKKTDQKQSQTYTDKTSTKKGSDQKSTQVNSKRSSTSNTKDSEESGS